VSQSCYCCSIFKFERQQYVAHVLYSKSTTKTVDRTRSPSSVFAFTIRRDCTAYLVCLAKKSTCSLLSGSQVNLAVFANAQRMHRSPKSSETIRMNIRPQRTRYGLVVSTTLARFLHPLIIPPERTLQRRRSHDIRRSLSLLPQPPNSLILDATLSIACQGVGQPGLAQISLPYSFNVKSQPISCNERDSPPPRPCVWYALGMMTAHAIADGCYD